MEAIARKLGFTPWEEWPEGARAQIINSMGYIFGDDADLSWCQHYWWRWENVRLGPSWTPFNVAPVQTLGMGGC